MPPDTPPQPPVPLLRYRPVLRQTPLLAHLSALEQAADRAAGSAVAGAVRRMGERTTVSVNLS